MKRLLFLVPALAAACGGSGGYSKPTELTDRRSPPAVSTKTTPPASEDDASKPPSPLKRTRKPLRKPTEARLSNGIRVLFLEEHDFPSASLGFVIDRGASAAPPRVAALYAQAIRNGSTKAESSDDARGELAWLGAQWTANASQDAVTFSITTLGVLIPHVIARSCAMAIAPTFDDKSLAEARTASKRVALRYRDDPSLMADVALRRLIFPEKHPYAFVPYGSDPSRFTQISKNELESFRDMYETVDRLTVVVAGDFKPAALLPPLERCLAGMPRKRGVEAPPISAAPTLARARIVLVPRPSSSQASIALGFVGVPRRDDSQATLAVLESLLGRELSGRLNLNIRGEHGFSYGVHMSVPSWRDGGMIEVRTSTDSAHAAETVKGLLVELQRIQSEPIDAQELLRAKLHATATSADSGLGLLESLAIYKFPLSHYEQLAEKIEAVSEAELHDAAKKYFASNVQIAIVGDPSLLESLRALGIDDVTVLRD